jgi:predicted dehydrogenase
MSAEPIRFGLCGTGHWAREIHAAAIAAHPDAQLAGVWGRSPERAASLADAYGTRAFTDLGDLLAGVDAVALALPPDIQVELAVRAAAAGRHLLLEKPLALSGDAADRVVEAVQQAGVASIVFHTARFRPEVVDWLDAVRRSGEVQGGSATWLASIFEPGNPFGESPWRREKGALWDVGPHAVDALVATLGPVDEVVAGAGRGDTVHLILHHTSHASSTASLSLTAPPAAATTAFWVYGDAGITTMPNGPTTAVEAYANAVTALVRAIRDGGGSAHPSDASHGRDVVRILESAATFLEGRVVAGL